MGICAYGYHSAISCSDCLYVPCSQGSTTNRFPSVTQPHPLRHPPNPTHYRATRRSARQWRPAARCTPSTSRVPVRAPAACARSTPFAKTYHYTLLASMKPALAATGRLCNPKHHRTQSCTLLACTCGPLLQDQTWSNLMVKTNMLRQDAFCIQPSFVCRHPSSLSRCATRFAHLAITIACHLHILMPFHLLYHRFFFRCCICRVRAFGVSCY